MRCKCSQQGIFLFYFFIRHILNYTEYNQQEIIFCIIETQPTKQRNALQIQYLIWLCCEHLQCVSLCVCVVSICSCTCCQTDDVSLICCCFFYLHLFSDVALRSALSATVVLALFCVFVQSRGIVCKRELTVLISCQRCSFLCVRFRCVCAQKTVPKSFKCISFLFLSYLFSHFHQ